MTPLWFDALTRKVRDIFGPLPSGFPPALPGTEFHDRRKAAARSHDHGRRAWSKVTGICLHQTACLLGERPGRWDSVGAHVGITRGGRVLWLHDFDRVVWHGNGWNGGTVGIEIDGLYAGIEGDPSTVWNDPSTPHREQGMALTPEAIEATKQVIRWIDDVVTGHGGDVRALVAHRQASESRRNDPGSAIWQAVALPMHAELGMTDGEVVLGGGRLIPEAWDPSRKGVRY
jgi:hypothetical protein